MFISHLNQNNLALIFLVLIFASSSAIYPQNIDSLKDKESQDIENSEEQSFEELMEDQQLESEESYLLDYLIKLETNPLNINTATSFELQKIPYINSVISSKIIEYRKNQKKFNSVAEIKNIEGIDDELYSKVWRFLTVVDFKKQLKNVKYKTSGRLPKRFSLTFKNRISNDLQPSIGYLKDNYQGSKLKIYNKLESSYYINTLNLQGGVLTEKDAGESNLFDFISGYVNLKNASILNQFLIGDYTLEFGQGIVFWGSLGFSKGNEAVSTVDKKGDGINPYGSVNEVQFFRGIASKIKLNTKVGRLNIYGFYSNNNTDASIDTSSGYEQLSTIYNDGYHRTNSEIKRDNAGKEKLYGGRVEFESSELLSLKLGTTLYKSQYNKPFKYKSIFEFNGTSSNAFGIDYNVLIENLNFFGEWARSYTGSIGGLSGMKIIS